MIDAARGRRAAASRKGRLVIAAVVDEEYASIGADALVREWRADGAVVTEPTDLQIGVGHKGFAWVEIETRGTRGARQPSGGRTRRDPPHGPCPGPARSGSIAICRRGAASASRHWIAARVDHRGGRELSSYPDRCRCRWSAARSPARARTRSSARWRHLLDELRREDREFEASTQLMFARPPYELPRGSRAAAGAAAAAAARPAPRPRVGMSFWTDAAILGDAGIPSVLFGPGGAGLHSVEEYVNVDDVMACRDALASLAMDLS